MKCDRWQSITLWIDGQHDTHSDMCCRVNLAHRNSILGCAASVRPGEGLSCIGAATGRNFDDAKIRKMNQGSLFAALDLKQGED
jgi:hypothetical protein